jgi:hypothetical protein
LNYRRRMDLGLPGDHDSDWLEAVKSISGKWIQFILKWG